MVLRGRPVLADMDALAREAMSAVRRWIEATDVDTPAAESRLARALCIDGDGSTCTESDRDLAAGYFINFINGVLAPQDMRVAAKNLERLSRELPKSANWIELIGTQFAGGFAPLIPPVIVPPARDAFWRLIGHLVIRGGSQELDKRLADLTAQGGIRPTLAPLTSVASGDHESRRQAADIHELVRNPGVGAILMRPAAILGNARPLGLDSAARSAVELLAPLYETASGKANPTMLTLDVAVAAELDVSMHIFERMMSLFPHLDVGISLPAYLPESLPALVRILDQAAKRRARGGAPVTVRLTKGDHLFEERARASMNGWSPAPFTSRRETDAQYLRLLTYALTRRHRDAARIVSATHNLFSVAFAWRLARARGVSGMLEHEFMLGIASKHSAAVKRDVDGVRLLTPFVQFGHGAQAAPYLSRRIRDFAKSQGFLTTVSRLGETQGVAREQESFLAALQVSHLAPVESHRTQPAVREEAADFTLAGERDWANSVLERTRDSASGEALLARSSITTERELEERVSEAIRTGTTWGQRRGSTRGTILDSVAEVLAEWRGLLVETAVSESSVTIEEADVDVTVAIAAARRAASSARELDDIRGASYLPPKLVVVVSSRSGPVADLAEGVLTAIAAGSAVIVKTAPETRRSAAVLIKTLAAGGVPEGLVTVLDDEGELARALMSDERVDHVVHSGSRHVAKLFHSWRAETRLSSTTGGRNAFIVTPSADLEAAVADVVESTLGHAGQLPLAISTVILVGSVGESARFLGRLKDSIASIPAVAPDTAEAQLSALARPATPSQRAMLDTLEGDETWVVEPRQLDSEGRLWSPGLRDNVAPDALFRRSEHRVPVLGIVRAHTLDEAIGIHNSLGFGLSAGLHSLDDDEIHTWLDSIEAGLACVNRPITSALRARVPVEGWDRAVLGTVRPGGTDAVVALGQWHPVTVPAGATVTLEGISDEVARVIAAAQPGMDFAEFDVVRAGAVSDEEAWQSRYAPKELVDTPFERIEHCYRPVDVTVRLSEGAPAWQLVRVLAAAAKAQSAIAVSTAVPLHPALIALFGEVDSPVGVAEVLVESDARWHARVQVGEIVTSRIRLIGGDRMILARVLHGQPGIAVYASPVTTSGRVELLPFLRGQSICVARRTH